MGIPKTKRNEILKLIFTPRNGPADLMPTQACPEAPHICQRRFYDFNPWSERQRIEKLRYMHRNRSYAYHEQGRVKINQWPKAVIKVRPVA